MLNNNKPSAEVTIRNRKGLHARASAKFVKCAESFDATVRVMRDGQTVGGTSIMGLMMLAAGPGSVITLEAEGPEGPEAIEAFRAMDQFIEELVKAGVFVAAAGLKNSAQAKRIVFDGPRRTVIDGPFAEARELVAGFSIWEVKDMDEAVAWAKRSPNVMPGRSEVEIRPFFEAADLAEFVSPEELSTPREGERGKLGVA